MLFLEVRHILTEQVIKIIEIMVHQYFKKAHLKSVSWLKMLLFILFSFAFSSGIFAQVNMTAATLTTSGTPYPSDGMCPSSGISLQVKIRNDGAALINFATKNVTVSITGTGANAQTFSTVLTSGTLAVGATRYVTVTAAADFLRQGTTDFAMSATCVGDASPGTDATETVTVAGNYIDLTSAVGTKAQTVCKNSSLASITYDVSYNATDATASGLPAGVSYSFTFPTLTITGSPTAVLGSPFSYTVTATGSCPSSEDSTLTGTITVNDLPVLSYVGNDSVCEGFTSSVSPTTLGTWSSSDPLIATITNGGAISSVVGGTTLFSYTNTSTGCSDTLSVFTVVPVPVVAAITGTLTVCAGLTTQLADVTAGGTWSSASTGIATVNPTTGLVNGVSAGTSVISYTVVSLGCTTVVTTTVTVHALPIVALITGTKQACVGLTTQLANATASGVWSSGTPAVATISGGGLITGITAGTSLVSYTVTNINGCAVSDTTTINIYAFPTVAAITGTTTVCELATSQLADATALGVWSSATPAVATIDPTGLVTGVSSGTSLISYEVTENGCGTTVTSLVTVNPLPIVAAMTGTTNVCVGATTQLANATALGVWSSATPAVATISAAGLVTGLTAGTSNIMYAVTSLGCTTIDSATVNVFAMPSVNAITGNTTVCAGSTTQLADLTPGGVWSSATPANATISAGGLVTGVAAGTSLISYAVTTNGCTTTSTATVTVTGLPVVAAIIGTASVCIGGTTSLTDATAGGVWSSDTPGVATIDALGVVTGVGAGTSTISYEVTQFGCSNTSTLLVTVNANPLVAAITGVTTICTGLTTQLACATPGGTWSSGTPANATISVGGLVTGVVAGSSVISYAITSSGCTTSSTTTVTVNASPTIAVITSGGGTNICPLSTSQMACATPGGTWSSASPAVATIDASGLATGVTAGTTVISYEVTSLGCTTTNTYSLTIDNAPTVAAITGSTSVCVGQTTQLASLTPGGLWSSASPAVATIDGTGLVTGVAAGSSSVISYAVSAGGCTTTNTATITVEAMPVVNAITGTLSVCSGLTTQLANTTPGGTWSSASLPKATVDGTGLVTGVAGGTSVISYAVTTNGCTTTVNETVTVTASPTVPAITGTTTLCANATSLLANTTAGGTWTSGTPANATIDATTGLVSGVSAGSSLITYSVTSTGCSASQSTTVTINPLPTVAAITGSANVCVGSTIPLANVTPAGTWSSSDPSVASITGLGVVTGVTAGAVTISYSVTSGGCTTASTAPVAVNAMPSVAAITGTTTFCSETTSQLACATAGGTWSSATTGVATIDGSGLVTGISAGTSVISYEVTENGCTTINTTTVTINTSPAVASITGGSSLCMGATLQLSNATAAGTWNSSIPGIATINASGLVTSVSPGTTIISYSKTSGSCTTTKTDTVTVYAMPVVAAITGNLAICAGSSSQLADVTANGSWSSATPGVASIDGFGMVVGVSAGSSIISYAVTTNGCTTTVTTTVNVTGALIVSPISGTTTVCENATTQLADATNGGTWSSATTSVATINSATGLVTGLTAGTSIITYSVVTNGVCPQIAQTTVTVNQVPTVNAISNITVCEGGTVNAITFAGNSSPTYQWTNSNTSIGLASSGTGNISAFIGTGTTTGGPAQTAVINVTPNMGGCVGTSKSFFITINSLDNPAFSYTSSSFCNLDANPSPTISGTSGGTFSATPVGLSMNSLSGVVNLALSTDGFYSITYTTAGSCPQDSTVTLSISNNPSVNITSDQSICDGSNFNAINFAGNPGSVFDWANSNATIGLASSGSGNIASFVGAGTTAGGANISGSIVVTPRAGSCIGVRDTFQLQVKAKDNASFTYPSNTFCTTLDANPIANITGKLGGTFSASPGGLTLNPSTGLITLSSSSAGSYAMTYTTNGTCPNTASLNLTIGDNPSVNAISSQTKCFGTNFDPITFSGSSGTSFDWSNNKTSIGLAASGSGDISSFAGTGVSAGLTTLSATVTVTPRIGSCTGTPKSFVLTLNYSDNVSITYSDNSYCAADANPTPVISGTTGGIFSASPAGLSINSATGLINILASTQGNYNVMYRTTGVCADTSIVPIGVSFSPSVNNILGQTVCNGTSFTQTAFTGSAGSVFDWSNSNSAIGLATSGTGTIASFTSTNLTASAIQGTVTVTPRAGSCSGTPKSFILKVNPVDDATFSYSAASYCSNSPDITPTISGTSGGTFTATPSAGISLTASTGKITIGSTTAGTYNITYLTPGDCPKVASNVITLHPQPLVNAVSNQLVCQDANFSSINFSGTSSTTFNWTNSNTAIGLASTGSGSISSFKASGTSVGGSPETGIVQVTPSIGSCLGNPITIVLTVNSFDNPSFAYSDNSYCKTQSNPVPTISGATGGSFSFTPAGLDLDNVSGAINLSNSTSGTYAITYTTQGSCPKDSTVSIAIGSSPIVNAISDQTVCTDATFSTISFSGNPGTVYDWTNTNTLIGLAASGSGDIPSFTASGTTIGGNAIFGTVTVTPRVGTCIGTAKNFKLNVNALDNANFSYSNTSFCKTESNPSPTISGLTGGTFNSSPAGLAMNASGTINLSSSLSGSYTINYTTHGTCPNVTTVPMSVGSAPTVNAITDQTICTGSNFNAINFTGSLGSVFNWTNGNTAIGLAASGTGNIPAFASTGSGVSTITVTPTTGTCIGTAKTFTLTASPVQATNLSYAQPSYCATQVDPSPTTTGPVGGVYSVFPAGLVINSASGLVNLASSTAGNYTVTYTVSGVACATSSTTQISVGTNPTVGNITSQTVCNDVDFNAITFSGSLGTQYTWVNTNNAIGLASSGTGNISAFKGNNTTNALVTGTITVTPSIGTCIGSPKSFTLGVNPSDDASFSYTQNKYCADASNPTPTILGTSGGTFSSNVSSITLNGSSGKITIGSSTAGSYDITYLTNGLCPKASTQVITLVPLPSVNSIADQTVCNGTNFNSVVFTGSANTQFDWTNSKPTIGLAATGISDITSFKATGTVPNGSSLTGVIVVTPKINGCLGATQSFDLKVNSMDDASFAYAKNSICQLDANPTPVISGTTGGIFTATPLGLSLNSSTGRITISTSTVNTYNIKYTTTGNCVKDSTISIVINPTASVNVVSSQQRCKDDSFNPVNFTGSANTTFNWTNSNTAIGLPASGTGNISAFVASGTIFGGSSIVGNLVVTPEINGCMGATKSFNLTVNPLDNPAFAYSDNSYCTAQGNPTPAISGTTGGTFTYTPTGLFINASTGLINLAGSTPNNYSITYTTPGNCKADSTVTIGVGGNPSLDDIDDQDVCEGTSFDPVVFTGNPGSVFSWTNSNATVGIPTSGNANIPAFIAAGVLGYRDTLAQMVVSSRIGTCIGNSVNFKYRVRAKPNIQGRIVQTPLTSQFIKDTSVCKGATIKLIATGISKNSDYHWSPNTALLGFPSSGASVTANIDSTQQFIIFGQNQFGCYNTDSVIVRMFNPKVISTHLDTTICAGVNFNAINFKGNTPTPTFSWTNSNPSIGLAASGVGNISTFVGANVSGSQLQSGTITVTPNYTIPSTSTVCVGTPSIFKLNVNKVDNPSFTGYLSQYCSNETSSTTPTITGTKNGVFSALPNGLVINPNSGQLFPTSSTPNTYFVKYKTTGVCAKADSMSVTIKPLLAASITGDKTICKDASQPLITFKGANGQAPYIFKYTVNGGSIKQIATPVSVDSVSLPVSTATAGTFVYSLVSVQESSASQCSNGVSGVATVNISTLPIAQVSGSSTVCEGSNAPQVTFTGINGTSPFTFTYAINGVTQPTITTLNGNYSTTVSPSTATSATYTYSLIGIKDGSSLGCYQPQNQQAPAVISVKSLPSAVISSNNKSVCINGTAPVITFTGSKGTQPYTFEYKVNGVTNYITSNNGANAVINVPTNSATKYVYELISVQDGGQNSCKNTQVSGKDSVDIIPGAIVNPLEDMTVCVGNNSGIVNFSGSANTTFNWVSNNTTTGITASGQGTIPSFTGKNTAPNTPNISIITVTPSTGTCQGKPETFKILVRPNPKPQTSPLKIICPGDSLLVKGITPNGISPDYQYIWTPDATLSCLDCPQVYAKPTKTTEYTYIAKDAFGCSGKSNFSLLVYDTPLIYANDTTLCGETALIKLKGKGGLSYVWSDGISDNQPFTPNYGVNKYTVTGKDKNGCSSTDTVFVNVLTQPKASFTLSASEVYAAPSQPASILITNTSKDAVKYLYNYGNGEPLVEATSLEPKTAIYKVPGVATVILTVYNGACSDSYSLPITIKKIDTTSITKLPNVFTPNGDGDNDEFMISVKNAKTLHLTIFNRWGNVVYEITDTSPTWDGKINGYQADEGVYFYEYTVETQSGQPITGNGFIQLIRK
jgi:trimeric autotransporter adhesin